MSRTTSFVGAIVALASAGAANAAVVFGPSQLVTVTDGAIEILTSPSGGEPLSTPITDGVQLTGLVEATPLFNEPADGGQLIFAAVREFTTGDLPVLAQIDFAWEFMLETFGFSPGSENGLVQLGASIFEGPVFSVFDTPVLSAPVVGSDVEVGETVELDGANQSTTVQLDANSTFTLAVIIGYETPQLGDKSGATAGSILSFSPFGEGPDGLEATVGFVEVPAPGTLGLLAGAGLIASRRRRSAA